MRKLRLENWHSSTNLHERHYFKGTINRSKYVFGINPHLFSKPFIKRMEQVFIDELIRTKQI